MKKPPPDDRFSNPSFWNLTAGEAFLHMQAGREGLTTAAAADRLKQYGPNTFKNGSKTSALILFMLQFKSPVTLLLIGASILSFVLGDSTNALIILTIVFISSALGWWQEKGATHAVEQLLKMVQIRCRVLRQGQPEDIHIEQVVPGDILLLGAGDVIPGDSLILDSTELFVDEAAFTGETFPVEKNTGVLPIDTPLAKRSNTLLMGAHITSGKATALVIKTGKHTEFGQISASLSSRAPETDFEKGIRKFGYLLMQITFVLIVIIFALNVFLHKPALDSFLFSLALAVGLTPQLLPTIITVNLAAGARNMARQQVIVKRLSSIENMGSMTILCSDKTGTITEGKIILKGTLSVSGHTSEKVHTYACLNASMQQGFHNPIDAAILSEKKPAITTCSLQSEIPYDFIRKRLTVQVQYATENLIITKGAFHQILDICTQAETEEQTLVPVSVLLDRLNAQYEQLSALGLRTLGVAYKKGNSAQDISREDEKEMIFLGFITLSDEPKANIAQTIRNLNGLGVLFKMITGDNALVAENLARQIGIPNPVVLSGKDMRQMSDSALLHQIQITDVFAEVEPNQKERIIFYLKKGGNVVGFIGDGINDASALHAADVGISVDSAVDVAKEAADIVLLNHDLNVLIEGIKEGRKTFINTMKYVFMATSANFGNMFSMAGASLFLPFLPLLPKQILLTNILTDFPETLISTDRVDAASVEKPQRWNIRFIQRFMITFGILSSVFDFITFGVLQYTLNAGEALFQTGWFVESVISAAMIVLIIRTRLPFFKSLPGKYLTLATALIVLVVLLLPLSPLAPLFGFVALPAAFYGWMLLIVCSYILCAEVTKYFFFRMSKE